jgi:serine phosphatase RsbU (regulator of sigma subunit)/Tfp pilus assembly protein PilF
MRLLNIFIQKFNRNSNITLTKFLGSFKTAALLLIIHCSTFSFATDSIYFKIKSLPDTSKIQELNKYSQDVASSKPEIALKCATDALEISERINDISGKIKSLINIGVVYRNLGKTDLSLNAHLKSLELAEKINDKQLIATNFNNIGIIYRKQNNFEKAMYYYQKAYDLQEETGNKKGMASILNNIGNIQSRNKEYDKALDSYKVCLQLEQEQEDFHGVAGSLNNIGSIYWHKGELKNAIDYFKLALKIFDEYNDIYRKSMTLNNIGIIYSDLKDYTQAIDYCNQSLVLAREIKDLNSVHYNYLTLAEIYSRIKDHEKAYKFHVLATQVKDSLLDEENNKKIVELQEQYESNKKEQEILILTKEKEIQEKELEQKHLLIYAFSGGFILVLIFALGFYRANRQKQIIHKQLEYAYKNIEDKNKDITDSINYAKQIQQAILPFDDKFKKAFSDYFIIFKPRDIVSGDYYWFAEKENKIFLAVVDCTGHGVPGAFMSMVGSAALNNIVIEKETCNSGKILNELHTVIRKALKQDEGANRDGMDMALCIIDKTKKIIEFSGAMNSLYVFSNEVFTEYKGDKYPIGGLQNEDTRIFSTQIIKIDSPSAIYMGTDGFADQFGGEQGKKFKSANLKKLLLSIQHETMEKQKEIISNTFETWKGELEQVDDVCIIGVRV